MLYSMQPHTTHAMPASSIVSGESLGLYIHIPFCARKCPYCDFNTYAGLGTQHERTVNALCQEMSDWGGRLTGRDVTSVFIGGGTPTVLESAQLSRLLKSMRESFALADDCEITMEANPGTVDRERFTLLHEQGVNRLSVGVQSFHPDELAFLGRIHNVEDVYAAFDAARVAGFDNISLDFIFGMPDQTTDAWKDTLAQALALQPEHLSLYSLIVEPDTPLERWIAEGKVGEPDDDSAGELYEVAMERLAAGGYVQYEVSNWMRSQDRECRHNMLYWHNGEYVGVGPGAHSCLRSRGTDSALVSRRWSNVKSVPEYVRRIKERRPIEDFSEELTALESMGETMMLGPRLTQEGIAFRRFEELYGKDMTVVYARELAKLRRQGLIVMDDLGVRLTQRGLMIGNQVFVQFLPDKT